MLRIGVERLLEIVDRLVKAFRCSFRHGLLTFADLTFLGRRHRRVCARDPSGGVLRIHLKAESDLLRNIFLKRCQIPRLARVTLSPELHLGLCINQLDL